MKIGGTYWAIVDAKGRLLRSAMDDTKPSDTLLARFAEMYGTARVVRVKLVEVQEEDK
jgi:hypothetical protein